MTRHFNRPETTDTRRDLRNDMPAPEVILWSKLKNRQLLGCKFRRQFGIESYNADFYSPELKLAIELDGETHFVPGAKRADRQRQNVIESHGIRVLRFLNSEIYDNLDGVWDVIAREARKRMKLLAPEISRGRRPKRHSRSRPEPDVSPS